MPFRSFSTVEVCHVCAGFPPAVAPGSIQYEVDAFSSFGSNSCLADRPSATASAWGDNMLLRANLHVLRPPGELDYFDSRSVVLPRAISPLEAWNIIMAGPKPLLRAAFRIRDAISACFGVRSIGCFSGRTRNEVKAGDQLDFFLVEHVGREALVLTVRDSHLDVMTCISAMGREVAVTSSVVTHNAFGRLYMVPVGPAHRLIVNGMLRRLKQHLIATSPDSLTDQPAP